MNYSTILPPGVYRLALQGYRRYSRYYHSREDYWQTVALVWLRCRKRIDPSRKPDHYVARSLSREHWKAIRKSATQRRFRSFDLDKLPSREYNVPQWYHGISAADMLLDRLGVRDD